METHSPGNLERLPTSALDKLNEIVVSVCIVTHQSRDLVRECLQSLHEYTNVKTELIVVDNGSGDGVKDMLDQEFPGTIFRENEGNLGFTLPMNQALKLGNGDFLLVLNPDTLILPHAVDNLAKFLLEHPDAGICGPKVLNRDRSLQKQCRRGDSRPWAVITYFTGLAALFPKSKVFGQYLMSYIDEDQTHTTDGVSGSCMMIRRELIEQIGYLDERFFAYQEDADYCFRARQAGWQVYYVPTARIIHFGGLGGSRVQPYRSIYEWHKSYYTYYKKNLAKDYFFLLNWFYYLMMGLKFLITLILNIFRKEKIAGSRKP